MLANDLHPWGVTERILIESSAHPNLNLARVITQERGHYTVVSAFAEHQAVVAGKLLYNTSDLVSLPAVGDWVMIAGDDDLAVIQTVLTRTSCIIRKAAGPVQRGQVIASNVDTVFICMALNEDFNLRRLERYLAAVWESGATPVVVLTKADLADDLDARVCAVQTIAIGAYVHVTAALERQGLEAIAPYISEGQTIGIIGSSGVGKSTLINVLIGDEIILTSGLRNDGQGRHTTTHREAILLPGGGVLIDTPGMREFGLDTADIERAFSDIEAFAAQCRFNDCSHRAEPGCAVLAAVDAGDLDKHRLASYRKLGNEVDYAGKSSRQIADEKINRIFGGKSGQKSARRQFKSREKNRTAY